MSRFRIRNIYHNGEDALLPFTGVLGAKDDHLHTFEVNLDGGCGAHAFGETVGRELTGVVDDEIRLAKVLELLFGWSDEHVVLSEVDGRSVAKLRKKEGRYDVP